MLGALVLGLLIGCAKRPPAAYAKSRAAAERAYAAGRYDEAAAHWLEAEQQAKTSRDAAEAKYRAAASWQRAGRDDRAETLFTELASGPASERQARAAFERARLRVEAGDIAEGNAMLDEAIRTFPSSGVARRALERRLIDKADEAGPAGALAYLDAVAEPLADTELAEVVAYQRARYLEKAGDLAAARDQYLAVAKRFEYPFGDYWDDSLYRAAELDVQLGRPREAIAHLEAMLSKREPKPAHGSLERPRFGPARFLLAEIYRDELGDLARARRTFLEVANRHPTSLLRDDALWEAAILARQLGNPAVACRDLEQLRQDLPDSRYAACAHHLCSRLPPEGGCRQYILTRIPESLR